MEKIDNEHIIKRFVDKWGDRFDYSDVEYKGYKEKVHIRCKEHNSWFWQTPEMHLRFNGCKECSKVTRNAVRALGNDEFIKRCINKYGDKYDYSKVNYINNHTEVEIICKKHGVFKVLPYKFLSEDGGCPICKKETYVNPRALTYDKIIDRFHKVHGDKYTYDESTFTKYGEKMRMICPIHGDFLQSPYKHISGQGCPQCGKQRTASAHLFTVDDFIEKANSVHDNKYDYSKTVYTKSTDKVTIICHEKDKDGLEHGEFIQNANSHLNGCGCPKCAQDIRNEKSRKSALDFINEAKKIHSLDDYDYSKVNYINNYTEVCIICPKHGEFWQTPKKHLIGHSCPKCAKNGIQLSQDEFIEKANKAHDGKYDYSKTFYTISHDKVTITCPIHGDFTQEAESHLNGAGCPKCSNIISKSETELSDFVKSVVGEGLVEERDRTILDGKEIDIYIPSYHIGIEYNGLYWHSEAYGKGKYFHLEKTELAKSKGVRLIQIFEDEWINKKNIVKSKLMHILHKSTAKRKIMARKCTIKEVGAVESNSFLEENHIQGGANASVRLGAFLGKELIGIMTFRKCKSDNDKSWELSRFASKIDSICQGIGGKLFACFIKKYNPTEVKSFADRRWTLDDGDNLYTTLGFKLSEILEPDYKYFNNKVSKIERIHKFNCRKRALSKLGNFPMTMTESEMANKLLLHRVWDCGLFKYIWKKE